MNYKRYSIEEFILDKKFRNWILYPDQETNAFWEKWLVQNPHKLEVIIQARELLLELPEVRHVYKQEREDRLWNKIVQEVNHPHSSIKDKIIPLHTAAKYSRENGGRQPWRFIMKGSIAASLLIIMSFVAAYFWVTANTLPEVEQREWVIKENPYGQRSTIYLSDGTEVILNAGSQLKYYDKFSEDKRKVMLTGEAFFQVAKDISRPFEVITENIVTKALGTSFNVKAFPNEPIQVSLVTGKVVVNDKGRNGKEELILQPGESAVYDLENPGLLKKEYFDEQRVLSWKEGIIYFQEADEKAVYTTLERWYGVNIKTLNTSPRTWDFTGEIKNMSLDQFLQSLSYTMNFNYHIENKQVTIEYHE